MRYSRVHRPIFQVEDLGIRTSNFSVTGPRRLIASLTLYGEQSTLGICFSMSVLCNCSVVKSTPREHSHTFCVLEQWFKLQGGHANPMQTEMREAIVRVQGKETVLLAAIIFYLVPYQHHPDPITAASLIKPAWLFSLLTVTNVADAMPDT